MTVPVEFSHYCHYDITVITIIVLKSPAPGTEIYFSLIPPCGLIAAHLSWFSI